MRRLKLKIAALLFAGCCVVFAAAQERSEFSNQEESIKSNDLKRFDDRKTKAAHLTIPDFQVNENAGGSLVENKDPVIATNANGETVIAWLDGRNGSYWNFDIYAQRFASDGSVQGENFKVNDKDIFYSSSLSAAIDDNGDFVIVWGVDHRDGRYDIYGQRFSNTGAPLSANFVVKNDGLGASRYSPRVSSNGGGEFVVVWRDERSGNSDIYAQQYQNDGTAIRGNFKVNDDHGIQWQGLPVVTVADNGGFVVAWADDRKGAPSSDIFAQRFSPEGSEIGDNFQVNDDFGSRWQWAPDICSDKAGNFIIAWRDERREEFDFDVYAQRYTQDGAAIGRNFIVNTAKLGYGLKSGSVSVTMDAQGDFVITWEDDWNDIYAQRYLKDGSASGKNFKINDNSTGAWLHERPSAACDSNGNFVIAWSAADGDFHSYYQADVLAQRFDSDGGAIGSNFIVNDDFGNSLQTEPAVAHGDSGGFVIAWADNRNLGSDIYAQRFSSDGGMIGNNFNVNDDIGMSGHWSPEIAVAKSGDFMIAWSRYSDTPGDILAQLYSHDGAAVGGNFRVNDEGEKSSFDSPSIAVDGSGTFVISWSSYANDHDAVFVQRYLQDGSALGSNFEVNDSESEWRRNAVVATAFGGDFIIAWTDGRNGGGDVYVQRFDSSGVAIGENFQANDTRQGRQRNPSIASDSIGNFVVVWDDGRNENHWPDIYAQRYAKDGSPIGANFKVDENDADAAQRNPVVACDEGGNFIIAWQESRAGDEDCFAQRYSSDGTPIGRNFRMTSSGEKQQRAPAVKLWNDRIFCAWEDNKAGGTAYDIWANVQDWNNPVGLGEREELQIPTTFTLFQNFPNPFNPTTTIVFHLPKSEFTTLTIFNTLGREVAVLVSEELPAGEYRFTWRAPEGLASGVYAYRLTAGGFTLVRKMILLR